MAVAPSWPEMSSLPSRCAFYSEGLWITKAGVWDESRRCCGCGLMLIYLAPKPNIRKKSQMFVFIFWYNNYLGFMQNTDYQIFRYANTFPWQWKKWKMWNARSTTICSESHLTVTLTTPSLIDSRGQQMVDLPREAANPIEANVFLSQTWKNTPDERSQGRRKDDRTLHKGLHSTWKEKNHVI